MYSGYKVLLIQSLLKLYWLIKVNDAFIIRQARDVQVVIPIATDVMTHYDISRNLFDKNLMCYKIFENRSRNWGSELIKVKPYNTKKPIT